MRHKKITAFHKRYACELKLWQISDCFNVVTHTFFRFHDMWLRVGDKLSDAAWLWVTLETTRWKGRENTVSCFKNVAR